MIISKEENRLLSLDVLRGAALFGILLVNIYGFAGPMLYKPTLSSGLEGSSKVYAILTAIFAQGSFYPMFALLFGAGTHYFYKKHGMAFKKYYSRRLAGLLLFGLFHVIFLWYGDILLTYAAAGVFLLFFAGRSKAVLLGAGIILFSVPNVLLLLLYSLAGAFNSESLALQTDNAGIRKSLHAYSHGSLMDIAGQRLQDWFYGNHPGVAVFLILAVLPFFLLGMYAACRGWFENHLEKQGIRELRLIMLFSGSAGLLVKTAPYYLGENALTVHLQLFIGGPLLALFYTGLILFCLQKKELPAVLVSAALLGKASLTCYLMQSFLLGMLFYPYGLGLYGKQDPLFLFGAAFLIYICQAGMMRLWLKKHRYGPIEKLWRLWTYRTW